MVGAGQERMSKSCTSELKLGSHQFWKIGYNYVCFTDKLNVSSAPNIALFLSRWTLSV